MAMNYGPRMPGSIWGAITRAGTFRLTGSLTKAANARLDAKKLGTLAAHSLGSKGGLGGAGRSAAAKKAWATRRGGR